MENKAPQAASKAPWRPKSFSCPVLFGFHTRMEEGDRLTIDLPTAFKNPENEQYNTSNYI